MEEQNNNTYVIAGAIIIAGLLIGLGIFASNGETTTGPTVGENGAPVIELAAVTEEDFIRGNVNAPIKIVEYSDFECPFCKRFQETMNAVHPDYQNEVAWVYRHFPLDQLHPVKARVEAVASECAAEQGGDEAFWAFADAFYAVTPSNNQTDVDTVLPQVAQQVGLNVAEFNTCVDEERFADEVQADYDDAVRAGAQGTPYSVVVVDEEISEETEAALLAAVGGDPRALQVSEDRTKIALGGALPEQMMRGILDVLTQ